MTETSSIRNRGFVLGAALASVIVLTIIRLQLVASLDDQGYFGKYLILADRWLAGDLPAERFSDISVAYLWIVTQLRRVFEPVGIRAFQVVLTTAAALLCGVAAWRIRGWIAGISAALFILASRSVLINATEIEPETMILVAVSGFLALFPFTARTFSLAIGGGLFTSVAIMLRPTFALPFLLVVAWLGFRISRQDDAVHPRKVLAFILAAVLPVVAMFFATRSEAGSKVSMNPGTVFYEGMNPYATGYAGVQPRIVNDLESVIAQPDSLHIAYRLVASRALGGSASPSETNRFWWTRAIDFAIDHPLHAIELTASKFFFTIHAHEAWDLITMVRKDRELSRFPAVSFGFLIPLAAVGLLLTRRGQSVPLVLLLLGQIVVLITFYVTARQRNALWPVVAILTGCALAEIVRWAHRRRLIHLFLLLLFLMPATFILNRPWLAQIEDEYSWTALLVSTDYWRLASGAARAGDPAMEQRYLVLDRLWLDDQDELLDLPPEIVIGIATSRLEEPLMPERQFDLAAALLSAGELDRADQVLSKLSDECYVPMRGNFIPRSVSWQRARVAIGNERIEEALGLLEEAISEAPGTPEIMATLGALRGSEISELREKLGRYVDPFSAELAIIRAMVLVGRDQDAQWMLTQLSQRIPEWNRPRTVGRAAGRMPSGSGRRPDAGARPGHRPSPQTYDSRSADATCMRAARIAGKSPPIIPISAA